MAKQKSLLDTMIDDLKAAIGELQAEHDQILKVYHARIAEKQAFCDALESKREARTRKKSTGKPTEPALMRA